MEKKDESCKLSNIKAKSKKSNGTERKYPCKICGRSFARKFNMKTHLVSCLKKISKEPCNAKVTSQIEMSDSSISYQCKVGSDIFELPMDVYPCKICGKSFARKFNMLRHHKRCTNKICNSKVTGKKEKSRSSKYYRCKVLTNFLEVPKLMYSCKKCGKLFSKDFSMARHSETCTPTQKDCIDDEDHEPPIYQIWDGISKKSKVPFCRLPITIGASNRSPVEYCKLPVTLEMSHIIRGEYRQLPVTVGRSNSSKVVYCKLPLTIGRSTVDYCKLPITIELSHIARGECGKLPVSIGKPCTLIDCHCESSTAAEKSGISNIEGSRAPAGQDSTPIAGYRNTSSRMKLPDPYCNLPISADSSDTPKVECHQPSSTQGLSDCTTVECGEPNSSIEISDCTYDVCGEPISSIEISDCTYDERLEPLCTIEMSDCTIDERLEQISSKETTDSSRVEHPELPEDVCEYVCDNCGKAFNRKYDLFKHYKTCIILGTYCCHYCEKIFDRLRSLNGHFRLCPFNPDKKSRLKCRHCLQYFVSRDSFKEHSRICKELRQYYIPKRGNYVCKTCQIVLDQKRVWQHLKGCRSRYSSLLCKDKCFVESCNFKYCTLKQLMKHTGAHHSITLKMKSVVFESFHSFFKWKEKEEKNNFSVFSVRRVIKGKSSTYHYYNCQFRKEGSYCERNCLKRKKHLLDRFVCPAKILVIETADRVTATYFDNHSHPSLSKNAKHLRMKFETKKRIKKLLVLGYTPSEILESFKLYNRARGIDIPVKDYNITRKQIFKIKYELLRRNILATNGRQSLSNEEPHTLVDHSYHQSALFLENTPDSNDRDVNRQYRHRDKCSFSMPALPGASNVQDIQGDSYNDLRAHHPRMVDLRSPDKRSTLEGSRKSGVVSEDKRTTLQPPYFDEYLLSEKAACRILLRKLDNYLSDKKIDTFIHQMYSSLKELDDLVSLSIDDGRIEIGEGGSIGVTSRNDERVAVSPATDSSLCAMDDSENEESLPSPEMDIALNKLDLDEVEYSSSSEGISCSNKSLIKFSSFMSEDNDLMMPCLIIDHLEINHLEMKSLDRSISDEEVDSIRSCSDPVFEKGCLYEIVVDSFLYLLCLKRPDCDLMESWKVQLVIDGCLNGIEIPQKENLLMPYNADRNWILIIPHLTKRRMLILDSISVDMNEDHAKIARKVMVFLNLKLGLDEDSAWSVIIPDRCVQNSVRDSGVYMCYYAMQYLKNLSLTENYDPNVFRQFISNTLYQFGERCHDKDPDET